MNAMYRSASLSPLLFRLRLKSYRGYVRAVAS
jgi:hypothetical protein